jgi:hypothetical protein
MLCLHGARCAGNSRARIGHEPAANPHPAYQRTKLRNVWYLAFLVPKHMDQEHLFWLMAAMFWRPLRRAQERHIDLVQRLFAMISAEEWEQVTTLCTGELALNRWQKARRIQGPPCLASRAIRLLRLPLERIPQSCYCANRTWSERAREASGSAVGWLSDQQLSDARPGREPDPVSSSPRLVFCS